MLLGVKYPLGPFIANWYGMVATKFAGPAACVNVAPEFVDTALVIALYQQAGPDGQPLW